MKPIQIIDQTIHNTYSRSMFMQIMSRAAVCASLDTIVKWRTGYGAIDPGRPFWNAPSLLTREEDEPEDAWTRRVVSEYIMSVRMQGDVGTSTGGIDWQSNTNVLSLEECGLVSWVMFSEFLEATFHTDLSSREKHILVHPNSVGALISIDYSGVTDLPTIGWTHDGWRIVTDSGRLLWVWPDWYMPDNGRAYILDEGCLGRFEMDGNRPENDACICPIVRDTRAFGVIRLSRANSLFTQTSPSGIK